MVDEAQFENIFTELKKIQQLEESDVQLRVMYGNQKDEINKVKSELGLDDNESDIKKNVVGGEDAPSRLTSNERNRYKNIGKAFVEGAGQQFKNIQKAIKFKENMSTIKHKFFGGIDKIKTGIKNAVGSGDFWKKLLKIIGLLGIIVYLYKEKISRRFPDLSKSVSELFGGLKDYFGGLVSNIYDFVAEGIYRSFEAILDNAFLYIPSIIDTFFGYTLPTAITNLYLEILSLYGSDSAQEELNKRFEESSKENSGVISNLADVAEGAVSQGRYEEDENETQFYQRIKNLAANLSYLEGEVGGQSKYETLSENSGILAFEENVDEKPIQNSIIKYVQNLLNDRGIDIGDMMKRNYINMNTFAFEIKRFSEDNNLTNQEVIYALQRSVTHDRFLEEINEDIAKILENGIDLNASVVDTNELQAKTAFSNFVKTYDKLREDYKTKAEKSRDLQDKYDQELMERRNKFKNVSIEIDSKNVGNIIKDALISRFGNVVDSISNFIKGDTLKVAITEGLLELGNFYSKFFNESIEILKTALGGGLISLEQITNKANAVEKQLRESGEVAGTTTHKESDTGGVESITNNHLNNNVIVNVKLNSSENSMISSLIGQLNDKEVSSLGEIQTSNGHLEQILQHLKSVIQITGVTESYVQTECNKLKTEIQTLMKVTNEVDKETNNRISSLGNTVHELFNSTMPYISTPIQQVTGFA